MAGPGSGKTKTLTIKMARLLAEDVAEPRGVACITYNNECVRELEGRLSSLGVDPGGRIFVGTIHSFSLTQVILPYAKVANLGLPEDFLVATNAECSAAFNDAVQRVWGVAPNMQTARSQMGSYRRSILNRDSDLWRDTNPRLAQLAEAYEADLRGRGLVDFDDMPLLAVRALRENSWLQTALLAKYPVLVVDEYQDLGAALHRMVMGLCFGTGMRLFAVGDVDQSIYGFTGAQPQMLQRLAERDDVETIRLQRNYRSGHRIVAASGAALGVDRGYAAVAGAPQGEIYFHSLVGSYEVQARRLMTELVPAAMAREPGVRYDEIAILYPAAWIGNAVAEMARTAEVPFIRTDGNALYPRSSRLMQWLERCAQWCCGGWRTGSPRFSQLVSEGRKLFRDAIRAESDAAAFHRALVACLWEMRRPDMVLYDWLQRFIRTVVDQYAQLSLNLRDELNLLGSLLERVSASADYAEMTVAEFAGEHTFDRLMLSTLHSAKGREFRVVFLFGIDHGRLPRAGASSEELNESRRLFYVGISRARTEVHVVHTHGNSSILVDELQARLG